MKYNSIGEQLIAKAKELDPNYKPDKFNDMSEAINIILNNSGSGDSSGAGKLNGFTIDVSNTYNPETKEFSGTLTDEQWTKVQNEQIYWINVVYINNQETGEEASATLHYNSPFFGEAYIFSDGDGSAMFIYDKSIDGMITKAALTVDTQGTPTSQLIPSITTSNEQQNLTIGNGLIIENGTLQATSSGFNIFDNAFSIGVAENINEETFTLTEVGLNKINSMFTNGKLLGLCFEDPANITTDFTFIPFVSFTDGNYWFTGTTYIAGTNLKFTQIKINKTTGAIEIVQKLVAATDA